MGRGVMDTQGGGEGLSGGLERSRGLRSSQRRRGEREVRGKGATARFSKQGRHDWISAFNDLGGCVEVARRG